jgi:pimeloyl-ACP methyl ester carboxylesterase
MRRLAPALAILLVAVTARAELPAAPPLAPSAAFHPSGPETAAGALVWLHGGYDKDDPPPPEQPWVHRLAADGYDIWRFDRPDRDPLGAGEDALAHGLAALKASGYRRIIVAGQSRGAFIGLAALAMTGVVDAMAAISPAAHGTNPDRRPQAMADFRDLLARATPMRFALVQFRDDDFDPDPDGRAALVRETAARVGFPLLLIDRPPEPTGHEAGDGPDFDAAFGACLTRFLEGKTGANPACP